MFYLKMGLILFISINLEAALIEEDEGISSILFNEYKNFSDFQKGNDLIYGSLDFNLLASDSLYELALKEDIDLIDRIYLLKKAININNFKATPLKEIYTYYFALLLRQSENKNMYKEIISLYENLNEELQIDKDLICMRLEASGRLESFGDAFKKILLKAFSLYGNDFLFFKWFLKEDRFFFSIFNTIKSKEDFFFTAENINYIFRNSDFNYDNSVSLFSFLKGKIKEYNGIHSIYFLKYKLLDSAEAYSAFKKFPPETINEYKMFYDLLEDPDMKSEFLEDCKRLSGIYCIDNKNNIAILKDGVLVGIFSGIVDFSNKFSLNNRYFNKVYFKDKFPVYYENDLLGYKINYSAYPYVDMIEVQYPDKRDVYTFALHTFKLNLFNNLDYDFNNLGIKELFLTDIKDFFLPSALNLFFEKISVLDIRSSLISKKKYFGFNLVEIKNYVVGSLVSIYRKVNGSKKFNYIEIYEKDKLKIKKALLDDDSFESYYSFEQ
ncbi:hypothetical protein SAMN02983004_00054 [Borreliella japonica]|uniref:Uncharacterized protein n=1 Tax=Borreliella japonica TaxID=34095 RepID=A0A1G4P286_BORJA|nr:hypothetical protein [Borreliella japonica]WKC89355.1 hypothetical protein QIA20_04610 [Borreliella japonica]SCW26370.1 hypothetical protein SAMN02983004_00054 [Borreliella japonica]